MAKAETQTMMNATIITIVATSLTRLNICLSCLMKPMRKPVPMKETTTPMLYRMAKSAREPDKTSSEPMSDKTKPPIKLIKFKERQSSVCRVLG